VRRHSRRALNTISNSSHSSRGSCGISSSCVWGGGGGDLSRRVGSNYFDSLLQLGCASNDFDSLLQLCYLRLSAAISEATSVSMEWKKPSTGSATVCAFSKRRHRFWTWWSSRSLCKRHEAASRAIWLVWRESGWSSDEPVTWNGVSSCLKDSRRGLMTVGHGEWQRWLRVRYVASRSAHTST
jgi:hypothetical protein